MGDRWRELRQERPVSLAANGSELPDFRIRIWASGCTISLPVLLVVARYDTGRYLTGNYHCMDCDKDFGRKKGVGTREGLESIGQRNSVKLFCELME